MYLMSSPLWCYRAQRTVWAVSHACTQGVTFGPRGRLPLGRLERHPARGEKVPGPVRRTPIRVIHRAVRRVRARSGVVDHRRHVARDLGGNGIVQGDQADEILVQVGGNAGVAGAVWVGGGGARGPARGPAAGGPPWGHRHWGHRHSGHRRSGHRWPDWTGGPQRRAARHLLRSHGRWRRCRR